MSSPKIRFAFALLAAVLAGPPAGPLSAQQEVGADDFRISVMGGSGDFAFRATHTAVAYNATDDEYLVVWTGDTDTGGLVDNQYQIFGQRLDGTTGAPLGSDIQISNLTFTPTFIPDYRPAVAWDATHNQYLVVWSGITGQCCEFDFEIFVRRLSGAGAPLDTAAQVSHMAGPPANPNEAHFDAYDSAVAYNPAAGEFLVVWSGDDGRNGRLDEEFEIHGQRISAADGTEVGADDFRISDAGGTGNAFSRAQSPAVVYNPIADEYLVVWSGEDLDAGTADGEFEIYGQRLAGATAAELGTNDFRISAIGPAGDTDWFAGGAGVAHNPDADEYLVVFTATESAPVAFTFGLEIFAQRLDAAGAEIGADDFRLSDVGGTGETFFDADSADVVYSAPTGRYLVSFRADDDGGGQIDGEIETFIQAVDAATGAEVGPNDLRLSDMGPNGTHLYQAAFPALACSSNDGTCLVVWQGDDDTGGMVNDEFEIFGQLVSGGPLFADGFGSGDTGAWSAAVP